LLRFVLAAMLALIELLAAAFTGPGA